jgi:G3E family GTPase
VTDTELEALEQRIRGMNAIAKVYRTREAQVDLDTLLGVNAFDLSNALQIDPEFLNEIAHEHDETVSSLALVEAGELDVNKLEAWLGDLLRDQGPDIFRMKGILNLAGEECRFVFQGVHMLFDGRKDRAWKPNEPRTNELVFIGRNLEPMNLAEHFRACFV